MANTLLHIPTHLDPPKIYADGADLAQIEALAKNSLVEGFTTNPSLMRKSGVANYGEFIREVLQVADGKPVSFEVFADDFTEMQAQAQYIYENVRMADSVYVKVPVTDTRGNSTGRVVGRLLEKGIWVNATAVFTLDQVVELRRWADDYSGTPMIVSVFAGRVADAGLDPVEHMRRCSGMLHDCHAELLWASPRQVYDVVLAAKAGADIITLTPALIDKLSGFGKSLENFSLETVKMFHDDAKAAGLKL